ncbi:MAG TPA: thiamine phosphate synthase [Desulfobulbaceae bacterium]|nr:MAG: thiamine-phosphate diphosphorylase [Deltaproteobacteria bacterium RIFOXYD12_FULL_53_23]HCC55310.1 thiamine phosphate synthase [Desulfobulbaceae bacterium]
MHEKTDLYRQRLRKFIEEVTLYPVSCERLAMGRDDIAWLDEVLTGGAKIVQLRDKESSGLRLFEKAKIFRRKTLEAGALFIVNDRVDIALLSGADGVHLGNSDIPAAEVRAFAPELIIGVSCNTEEQAASAEKRGASYFNIGPLYATQTKDGLSTFLGPAAIPRFSARSTLPFTVMGGIKREHIPELTAMGARRMAVVTALTCADDIAAETSAWLTTIRIQTTLI